MKRVIILALITILVVMAVAGCNDESKPEFTRVNITPACGVVPLQVQGYAVASGGDESGSPTGGNNNLEIKWDFGDGTSSFSSISYHSFDTPGDYTVTITGTDNSGEVTTTSRIVQVLPDTLYNTPSIIDHADFMVTTEDTFMMDVEAGACQVDPEAPGDYRKLEFEWNIVDTDSTYVFHTQNPVFSFSQPGTYEIRNRVTLASLAVTRWNSMTVTVSAK